MVSHVRLVATLMIAASVLVPFDGRADPEAVAALGAGDSAFWDGPFIEDAGVGVRDADALLCRGAAGNWYGCIVPGIAGSQASYVARNAAASCEAPDCSEFSIDLMQEGARLRVALDHPDIRDVFEVSLLDPSGILRVSSSGPYSTEAVVNAPAPGRWKVRVVMHDVEASAFRMRAFLEPANVANGSLALAFTPDPQRTTGVDSPEGCEIEPGEPRGTLAPPSTTGVCHSASAVATSASAELAPAEFTSSALVGQLGLGGEGRLAMHIADPANPAHAIDSLSRCIFLQLDELSAEDGSRGLLDTTLCVPTSEGRTEFRFRLNPATLAAGSRLRVRWEQADGASTGARYLFGGESYADAGVMLSTFQPAAPEDLLPNLKATPPFDLVFAGCQASEIVQYQPHRCLRFSAGPANVGDGPLDLRIQDAGATSGVNWQRIHRSDGSFLVRPAGTYEWHAEHLHYHHVGTGEYRLYRVVDEHAGELASAGQGPKIGFCMGDYLIADWQSFDQDQQGSGSGTCFGVGDAPLGTQMGLTKGWGDIYTYNIEGNYVDFGTNPDGLYVIRVATDPGNDIAELIEDDNHGYAYIRVTGDHIEVLERGYGTSPWDPAKVLAHDIRPPTA